MIRQSWLSYIMIVIFVSISGCQMEDDSGRENVGLQGSGTQNDQLAWDGSIKGVAVKGPLAYAAVHIYKLDMQNEELYNSASPIAVGSTDNFAQITGLDLANDIAPPFILVVDGHNAVDLDTNQAPVIQELITIIKSEDLNAETSIAATPLTTLAFQMARNAVESGVTEQEFLQAIDESAKKIQSTLTFGVSPDIKIFSTPALLSQGGENEVLIQKAIDHRISIELFSGLVAQLAEQNEISTAEQILELATDLQPDGVFDNSDNIRTLAQRPETVRIPNTEFTIAAIGQLLENERQLLAPSMQLRFDDLKLDLQRVVLNADIDSDGEMNAVDDSARKFNPGHYMTVGWAARQRVMEEVSDNPDIVGIQKRYLWSEIEPAYGEYDFSEIEADLNYLRSKGKKLVVQIQDKSFLAGAPYVPDYLINDPQYNGGVALNRPGGWTPKKWNHAVQQRLAALYRALGARFDREDVFEGLVITESMAGVWGDYLPDDYTPEAYRDGLISLITYAKEAFPRTTVIQYINGLDENMAYLADVVAHAQRVGAGIGGPDILPEDEWLLKNAYKYYERYAGTMPLGTAVQPNDYRDVVAEPGLTQAETILKFGKEQLHLDYIFWEKVEPNFTDDVIPTLEKYRDVY